MNFPNRFIKATELYNTLENNISAPYFRKTFTVLKGLKNANLIICGLGYYELFLNGKKETKGFLAPYRSNPDDIIYYDTYNFSGEIKEGKNVIACILGNGIINSAGAFVWDFDKTLFRSAPILTFSLELEYEDGTVETIISDEYTKTAPSPIIFDDLHFGEYYNANLEIDGWNTADFDDSQWQNAMPAQSPRGEARICEAEPIKVQYKLNPVSVTKQDESYLYDFGVNAAGLCTLKINGKDGQKVLLQYGEIIVDGKLLLTNFRFNTNDRFQEDEYYCNGKGTEEYTPSFTYHGFRYVLVTGITAEQATHELLTYLVINSDINKRGSFECDNEVINKIQEITLRSDLSNFHYFPTDCPQREKNGWTADAALSAEQMLLNLTPEKSYKEWMRNIYKALSDKGQLPGIVPTGGWGYQWGNGPAWDNVIIYLPYYTYKYTGDITVLEELANPLMRYLNYLYTRLDGNNLMYIGLGDWCQVGRKEDDYDAPLVVTDSILTMDIAKKSVFVFDTLGMKPQMQFAQKLYDTMYKAVRTHLIDIDTMLVNGNCQTCQAMALYYGIFNDNEKDKAFNNLINMIKEKNGHFDTGVLGGRIIYRVLSDFGYTDLAFNMAVRSDFPSYGNWVARGATSLWEAFLPEDGRILSLNHHFWGDISAWFYIYLAGIKINPDCRNINRIDIAPNFATELSHVKAEYIHKNGSLNVEWNKKGNEISLNLSVPVGIEGEIKLPSGYCFPDNTNSKALKSGKFEIILL